MLKNACISFLMILFLSSSCFADATVFFKDNTKETGNSAWVEGSNVYLNKSNEIYQFPADEVLMEETLKFNKIGKYANIVILDEKSQTSDLVEQIIQISGFDQQMDMLVNEFKNGFQSMPGIAPELSDIFTQALAGFSPEKEKRLIRSYYRSKLDKNTLETLLAWMKSPTGSKILAAENSKKAFNPEILADIEKYYEEHPPTAKRISLISDLDKAAHVTEMTRQIMSDTMSVVMGAMPKEIRNDKAKRKEMDKLFKEKMEETRPMLAKLLQQGLIYTYRDISDSELEKYIAFLNTKEATKYMKATYESVRRMTKSMASIMIRNIVKNVEKMKSK